MKRSYIRVRIFHFGATEVTLIFACEFLQVALRFWFKFVKSKIWISWNKTHNIIYYKLSWSVEENLSTHSPKNNHLGSASESILTRTVVLRWIKIGAVVHMDECMAVFVPGDLILAIYYICIGCAYKETKKTVLWIWCRIRWEPCWVKIFSYSVGGTFCLFIWLWNNLWSFHTLLTSKLTFCKLWWSEASVKWALASSQVYPNADGWNETTY